MNACIIFDASGRLTEIKTSLKSKGYWASWSGNGLTYHLPQNSLWKPNCELSQAKSDIIGIIAGLNLQFPGENIILKRCIVLPVNPWDGIQGILA
jgi:hypothetical protein